MKKYIGFITLTFILVSLIGSSCSEAPTPAPAPAPTPATKSSSTHGETLITISDEAIEWLSIAIASEAGSVYDKGKWVRCTDEERAAVGWTIINRLNTGTYGDSIKGIVTAKNQYAYNQQPNSEIEKLAKRLLEGEIDDMTEGATNFFSPISMPKEGESTTGFDTGGGLHTITGIDNKVYFPSWAETMNYVGDIHNVRQAYFMFYRGGEIIQKSDQTTTQSPSIENFIELSAYDFVEKLYDPDLTSLQRQEFWDQYQGEQVSWVGIFSDAESGEDNLLATFVLSVPDTINLSTNDGIIYIKTEFEKGEKSKLLDLQFGDLVSFVGILDSYNKSFVDAAIYLTDGNIESLVIQPLWWKKDMRSGENRITIVDDTMLISQTTLDGDVIALDIATGKTRWETTGKLGAFDNKNAYIWDELNVDKRVIDIENIRYTIEVGFKVISIKSGELISDDVQTPSFQSTKYSIWAGKYPNDIKPELEQTLKDITRQIAGQNNNELMVLNYRDEYSYEKYSFKDNGITYESRGSARWVKAIDDSDSVIWVTSFPSRFSSSFEDLPNSISDFIVLDGVLYIYLDMGYGVRAFRILYPD